MSATNPIPTDPTTADGRDGRGRFAAGNTFGGGNPFARRVASLRAALLETVTEQDVREIAYVLLLNAKAGDLPSIKLLFQYTLGKPQPFVNPDRLAIDEMQTLRDSAIPPEVVGELTQRLPVEFALGLARLGLEASAANHGALLGDMLQQSEPAGGAAEAAPEDPPERARRRKAEAKERKRRRKEARRKMRNRPSTNGGNGKSRPSKPRPAPSTTAAARSK